VVRGWVDNHLIHGMDLKLSFNHCVLLGGIKDSVIVSHMSCRINNADGVKEGKVAMSVMLNLKCVVSSALNSL
jgi:hypothetical protein